jgi:hypothetical protein
MPPDSQENAHMQRSLFAAAGLVAALAVVALPAAPSFAVTAKQKAAICKFGADDQKLKGAARKKFIAKCMANKDDPRGTAAPAGTTAPPAAPTGVPPPRN